ncbi:MAG: MFS transporter [Pseudomonadota bacterium]
MLTVLKSSWALLLGMFLLMFGNGLQGSLIGIRGDLEGFDPGVLSYVVSAYFLGFIAGSWAAPALLRKVGHVRVFAAMASLISAAFVIYPALPDLIVWGLMRCLVGFCFACVYVVVESWLNDAANNKNRGKALSLYMIVQMLGLITAQGALNLGDVGGYGLFILISVLVSISFTPVLLNATRMPVFETADAMSLKRLFDISPLGVVGMVMVNLVYSVMFGMAAVYGTQRGLSIAEISILIAVFFAGGMLFQYPVGWASDRMDRRLLIIALSFIAASACIAAILAAGNPWIIISMAGVIGATVNPLYALVIAHTNDYLEPQEMAAASSGLLFFGGFGAIFGPIFAGNMMQLFGPPAFFGTLFLFMITLGIYGLYRSRVRPSVPVEDTTSYPAYTAYAGAVAVEIAQEYAIDQMDSETSEPSGDEKHTDPVPNA